MEAESQPSAASKSEPQNDPGKMFVGGLSWQTSADGLREYFSKFGELKECVVMKDPISKRSRCFGFVTFADPAMVDKVISSSHELDNKKVDPKPAIPKKPAPKMITKTKKIFVGGLSTNTKKEDIVEFFQQFGKITDTMLLIDKNTERSRGFGFVTFETEEIAEKVVEQQYYTIKEKRVEVKKAQPKEVMYSLNAGRGRAGRGIIGRHFLYPGFANYGRGYPGPGFGAGFGGYQLATYNAALATAFAAQGRGRGRGRGGAFMGAYGGGAMGYPGFHGRYMGPGEQRRNPGAVQGYYAEYATISNPSGRVGTGTRPEVPHLNTVPEFPDYNRVQMNSYTQQQFGAPPHSPVSRGFGQATSPGPVVTQDMGYISSPGPGSGVDHVGYASTSPQPAGFGPGMAY